jgi:hypothetical protein
VSKKPDWLPPHLDYPSYCGDWQSFLADVYRSFQVDFKDSRPSHHGRPVVFDTRIDGGKEEGFWHIVSERDATTGERVPQIRRCERVSWVRPIIEHSDDESVSLWKLKVGRHMRVLLWLEKCEYLVVLEEKLRVTVLVTAYCIDREHTRRKLRKQRAKYTKKQTPPQ